MNVNLGFISDLHQKHLDWDWTLRNTDEFGFDALMQWNDCDIIFFNGDMSRRGSYHDCRNFMQWFNKQPGQKVMIAGNHDFFFDVVENEKRPRHATDPHPQEMIDELLAEFPDIHYLNDSGVELYGLKIWGSPITPWFHNWAFNRQRYTGIDGEIDPGMGDDIRPHWDLIPKDIDVLLTHGPPYGFGDHVSPRHGRLDGRTRVGCKDIIPILEEIKPKIHAFGHIHEAYGVYTDEHTKYINASCLNDWYEPSNAPIFETVYL